MSPALRRRHWRLAGPPVAAVLAAGIVGAAGTSATAAPTLGAARSARSVTGFGTNWTVYHGNPLGTGVENAASRLRPLRPAWKTPALDGQLFGEPLVEAGRVFAATENDTVYAFAADTGRILWSRHLGAPVPSSDLPCGDISPDVGVTGTPVIDPARQELFVVALELAGTSGASHRLIGLDLDTGRVELDEAVDPPRSTPTALLQRPGLALDAGRVIVAFGGNYGDCGNYHGTVAAVPETGGTPRYYVLDTARGQREGAIWMGGAAPVVDRQGNVWVAVGNGSQSGPPYDHSDSVTELSASLRREQSFSPATWAQDNRTDADLGSTAPAFVGGDVLQVGKAHVAYLLDARHLGGVGHQLAQLPLCSQDPHGGLVVRGRTLYVACGEGVTAVRVSSGPPRLAVLWTTPKTPSGVSIDGPPVFAGGLIWSLDAYGTLWAINPANGAHVVSEQTNAGEPDHFPTPTVADGLLLAPTTDQLFAYQGPAGRPGPPA